MDGWMIIIIVIVVVVTTQTTSPSAAAAALALIAPVSRLSVTPGCSALHCYWW